MLQAGCLLALRTSLQGFTSAERVLLVRELSVKSRLFPFIFHGLAFIPFQNVSLWSL